MSNNDFVVDETTGRLPIDAVTYTGTYGIINGKCAWCGEDATDLPMKHFEQHETEEMQRKVEILQKIQGLNSESLISFYGETCAASMMLRIQEKYLASQMAYADAQVAYNEILRRMKS